MRRKHDGIARFQGDHGLVAHRGGGVGAGDDGGDDPHRHADLPELFLRNFPENAHGLHAPNRLRHPLGGEEILSPFVLRIAEARLLNRHFRQRGRLCRKGFGHRFHDGVQLALGQFGQLPLRRLRPARQLPRFADAVVGGIEIRGLGGEFRAAGVHHFVGCRKMREFLHARNPPDGGIRISHFFRGLVKGRG